MQQNEETIFDAALKCKSSAEQIAYVVRACGNDARLRADVEALLRAHDSQCLLDEPVLVHETMSGPVPLGEGPGTVIGRYKLREKIGEGGMAVVYMAEQEEPIRRKVALKIIKLGMDTKQVIARFEAERQALAMMDHPNIARVFDAGATETGRPYFVMELVTGVAITEYCDKNNLSTKDRLALFVQVCNAVQHAHQKGIIHRDIKPSNVMVTQRDDPPIPKVIDFGIAKATNQKLTEKTLFTRYAHIIGTPAYMSPEQAELSDVDIDTRSDIYSLGVLLYELLTGTTPFSEEELREAGYVEMQRVIREEEPTKPSTKLSTLGESLTDVARQRSCSPDLLRKHLRGDLDWIVMKSLEKDRTRRYDSTSALLDDIKRHLNHEPVAAGPPNLWYRTNKFVQRHGALVATLAAVVIVVLTGFIVSVTMYHQARRARAEMDVARAEAQSVTDFLTNDLLASVYPERAKGPEVTVSYILDSASPNLEQKFAGSPLAEAEVRDALGLTYLKMGRHQESGPHLERALAIRRTELGEEHLDTLTSLDRLGTLRRREGRDEEAKRLLARAFDGRERILGPEHADTLESMTHLAWASPDGTALAERAYQTGTRVLGEEHPVTLAAAACLATQRVLRLQHAEAQKIAPGTYELARRVLGQEHETTLAAMNALVWLHERQGRHEEGAALGERAVEIANRCLGEKHMLTLWTMINLGAIYVRQGRYEEADALLTEAFEGAEQYLGPDHVITLCCTFKFALLYGKQGRFDEFDATVLQLVKTCRQKFGRESMLTKYARYGLKAREKELTQLAEEQAARGDRDEAAATLARLEDIRQELNSDSEQQKEDGDG